MLQTNQITPCFHHVLTIKLFFSFDGFKKGLKRGILTITGGQNGSLYTKKWLFSKGSFKYGFSGPLVTWSALELRQEVGQS